MSLPSLNSDDAYTLTRRVSEAGGYHRKMDVLGSEPGIQQYLMAAYNPYKKYFFRKIPKHSIMVRGKNQFDKETWDILKDLSSRQLSGNLAKSIILTHVENLTPKSAMLFYRIVTKDLRIGLAAKSINRVFQNLIPTHEVMLAKLFEPHRLTFPCYASPKIDGVRAIFKYGEFYSRGGYIYSGLERLKNQLNELYDGAPPQLDGELWIPGLTFQESSGRIRSGAKTPDAFFEIFEMPDYKAPFPERLMVMADIRSENIHPIIHFQMNSLKDVSRFYVDAQANGYEGAVIKSFDYEYKSTRSYDWMKMKDTLTYDSKVLNIFEGKGKYANNCGGVIIEFKGRKVRVGSGFTDSERKAFWTDPSAIIGRTIEIHYMEETDDGSMRHPRFFTFRPDKD